MIRALPLPEPPSSRPDQPPRVCFAIFRGILKYAVPHDSKLALWSFQSSNQRVPYGNSVDHDRAREYPTLAIRYIPKGSHPHSLGMKKKQLSAAEEGS